MIIDEIKAEYVKELIARGQRVDGRGLHDYREIRVTKNFVPNAEGSALAEIGKTKVLAGVKFEVMTPFPDRPDEGVIMFGSEFSPVAHPDFNPGPPDERSIELARVVDRGIRSADTVDVKNLFLEEGKVLGVFVDLYTLDHGGNLIDTAGLAAMAALKNTRLPKVEENKIVYGEHSGQLKLVRDVVVTSFEKIFPGKILVDANNEEEVASSGRLSLSSSSDGFICSGQKSGAAGFSKQEMLDLMDLSLSKSKELLKHV